MRPKSILAIAAVLCSGTLVFPQQAGQLSVGDLRKPGFQLSIAAPGVLVVRPFEDLFPGSDISQFLSRPQLHLSVRRTGTQAGLNVPGAAESDRWEFELPKLDAEKPYVAEFTLEGKLGSEKARTIGLSMVKDSKFMNRLEDWAALACNKLGPNEHAPVPEADRLLPRDPVPAASVAELHSILDSELQKQLPVALTRYARDANANGISRL